MTIKFYKPGAAARLPIQATKAINSDQRSKSKGLIHRIGRAIKIVWRDSLRADERGETFWHNLGSAVAIAAFICGMLWILGNTPAPGEYRTNDVLITAETGE